MRIVTYRRPVVARSWPAYLTVGLALAAPRSTIYAIDAFLSFTDVMAVHDYGMQFTPGVAEAVDSFCDAYGWRIDKIVATLAVLRRTSSR